MADVIWLVPILPLGGFLILGLLGQLVRLPRSAVALIGCGSVALSFAAAVWAAIEYIGAGRERIYSDLRYVWTDVAGGGKAIEFGLLTDKLSLTMLLVVTGVSLLIHIYSIGYMEHDEGFRRYFAYLNLFVFAMCLLVAADNYLLLLIGWANVGLASFLLIGFWFNRPSAVEASRLAIVVNVIGDAGIMLAIFLLIISAGGPSYGYYMATDIVTNSGVLTAALLLLMVGAAAKSAQLPLYIWLPDAMEGPTPVSALMHAATMVTAGVYLMVRSQPLFVYLSTGDAAFVYDVVGWVGGITALFAATIALTQRDIKRVLAYSTISQLGYMFLAIGVGANDAAIFHLATHAFFKACLFLSAGIIIHALGDEQDMLKMGGLGGKLRLVMMTFGIGTLALAAIPPFAGFFSKDAILEGAYAGGYYVLWAIGVIVAFLTALYMGRAFLLTFGGQPRSEAAQHPHAVSLSMNWTTALLALLSVVAGFVVFVPQLVDIFASFGSHEVLGFNLGISALVSLIAALAGLAMAYAFYGRGQTAAPIPRWLYLAAASGWGVPWLYREVIAEPIIRLGRFILVFFDRDFLEDVNRSIRSTFGGGGKLLSRGETGVLRNYALIVLVGVVAILIYAIVGGAK